VIQAFFRACDKRFVLHAYVIIFVLVFITFVLAVITIVVAVITFV